MTVTEFILYILLPLAILIPLGILVFGYGVPVAFRAIRWLLRHIWLYLRFTAIDAVRLLGHTVTAIAFSALVAGNVIFSKPEKAEYYGQAFLKEAASAGVYCYRVLLGHPMRLLYLHGVLDGVERRLPQVVNSEPGRPSGVAAQPETAQTGEPIGMTGQTLAGPGEPTAAAPRIRRRYTPTFEGYTILGTLAGGGSGGRLYVGRPDEKKLASLATEGHMQVGDVVLKSFSIREGSSLPQIIRESRSLEAAHRLGLILDHQLTGERFYYVMRYVPGDSLSLVTQQLHAASPPELGGLGHAQLIRVVEHISDLIATLSVYHQSGLWHKDIKPDNIIIHAVDSRAHLVDFGLLTPLRSSMTLTTHGTEYFRDPEMVRLALKGAKVRDVDGSRFDLYGAGAVMYAMLENSFPAHGALSNIGRRCPGTLKWIVRRAMTDYDKRYPSAQAMLADLEVVLAALNAGPEAIDKLRPADLPSVRIADREEMLAAGEPVGPPIELVVTRTAPQPLPGTFTGRRADGQLAERFDSDTRGLALDDSVDLRLVPELADADSAVEQLEFDPVAATERNASTASIADADTGVSPRAGAAGSPPPIAGPDTFGVTMLDTDAPASPVASAQQSTEAGAPRQHESARRTPGVSAASRSNSGPQPAAVFGGPAVPPTSPAPDKGFASRSPAVKIATVLFFICAFTILNWALSKPSTPKPKSSLVTRTDTPAANGSSSRAGIEPALPPNFDGKVFADFGKNVEEQIKRAFGPDFMKEGGKPAADADAKPAKRSIGQDLIRGLASGFKADGKPQPAPAAPAPSEPASSGRDLSVDAIAIDLHELPKNLMYAAMGASMEPTAAADVQRVQARARELMRNPLAALNVRTRLLTLTDEDLHSSPAGERLIEQVDMALRAESIVTIRQRLDDQPVYPNIESTLEAVEDATFGQREDAPKIRLAMRDLPGSPFCCGFVWLVPDPDKKSPAKAWLVLQPDTDPAVATAIIRNLRLVMQGKLGR